MKEQLQRERWDCKKHFSPLQSQSTFFSLPTRDFFHNFSKCWTTFSLVQNLSRFVWKKGRKHSQTLQRFLLYVFFFWISGTWCKKVLEPAATVFVVNNQSYTKHFLIADAAKITVPTTNLPPSSVMTTTLVGGPNPAGLTTCRDTRYCVNGDRSSMVNWVTSGSLRSISVDWWERLSFLGR